MPPMDWGVMQKIQPHIYTLCDTMSSFNTRLGDRGEMHRTGMSTGKKGRPTPGDGTRTTSSSARDDINERRDGARILQLSQRGGHATRDDKSLQGDPRAGYRYHMGE